MTTSSDRRKANRRHAKTRLNQKKYVTRLKLQHFVLNFNVETVGGPQYQVTLADGATVTDFVQAVERESGLTGVFYKKATATSCHPFYAEDEPAVVLNPGRYEITTGPYDQVVPPPGQRFRFDASANHSNSPYYDLGFGNYSGTPMADLAGPADGDWVLQPVQPGLIGQDVRRGEVAFPWPAADLEEGDLVVVDLEIPLGTYVGRVLPHNTPTPQPFWTPRPLPPYQRGTWNTRVSVEFTHEITNGLKQAYGASGTLGNLKYLFTQAGSDQVDGSYHIYWNAAPSVREPHDSRDLVAARWENVYDTDYHQRSPNGVYDTDYHQLGFALEDVDDNNRVLLYGVPRIYLRKV